VNFVLGKGLHSYGFGAGGQSLVGTFALIEIGFIFFALLRRPRPSSASPSSPLLGSTKTQNPRPT